MFRAGPEHDNVSCMAQEMKAIPEGYHSITPSLAVRGVEQAVYFYEAAFGAVELLRLPTPDGKGVMHAELRIGDSRIFVVQESGHTGTQSPQSVGSATSSLQVYVADADAVFNQAVNAGAKVRSAPRDMFWGDRYARITDPFGHEWAIATHQEDLTVEEILKRRRDFFNPRPV